MLQKRIVRLLSNSDTRLSDYSFPLSTPLFFKEKLLKVQDIFKIRIAKFIYTSLNKTSPANYGLKLIKVQGPKIWNDIPPSIRNITVSNIFVTMLKKSVLDSYNIQGFRV